VKFLLARLSSFLRNVFDRSAVDGDLDEELRAYVDLAADEKRGQGYKAQDARRAVLAEMQGLQQVTERVRETRAGARLDQLRQDLSYAGRMFVRNRGFTAAAVLTLALGIGASTAIFTIVDTVVYRPLPYADPARLVKICGNAAGIPTDDISYADFSDIREASRAFADVAADDGMAYTVTWDGARHRALGAVVTTSWLSTLGVRPVLGRAFLPEEAVPGRNGVTIITAEFWRRGFGADPSIVGRTLLVDGAPHTIIGVLPPNVLRYEADVLMPLTPAAYPVQRDHRDLDVFARLRPGVTIAQARVELDGIARRLEAAYPATNKDRHFSVIPLDKYYVNIGARSRDGLLLMLGAVGFVLLIACVNVASLMLARALGRGREFLIRAALGASRGRLIRQLLVENVLLFVAGGALGVFVARWAIDALHAFAVAGGYVPQRLAVAIDARVLAFAMAVSLVTGVVFGLAPALRASRVDLNHGLRDGAGTTGGRRQNRGRRALIVVELALSIVLLTSFGLLARSFIRVQASAASLDTDRVIETTAEGGREFAAAVAFWRTAVAQAETIPGIERAAVTSRPPVHDARSLPFRVAGQMKTPAQEARAGDIFVSSGYFATLGIPILEGRAFADADNSASPPVAIVSRALARRVFPDASAVGRRIEILEEEPSRCCAAPGPLAGVTREIVGVAEDVRQANLDEAPALTIYRPSSQIVEHDMFLLLRARTPRDAARITPELRASLLAAGVGTDWQEPRLLRDVIRDSESIKLRRFVLTLLGCFSGLALVLAGVGVYGVMAYFVGQRRREIAIRVALGATRQRVLRDVLVEAMKLALASLVLGGILAQLVSQAIASMLFGIGRSDVVTYATVGIVLAGVACAASYVPARRAARLDPIAALKES
jgi:putative ABC transport system permease protein